MQATAEVKLIDLSVAEDISDQTTNASFLSEAQDLYKMDAFSKSVVDWIKLRSDAVEMVFKTMLFLQLRKETICEAVDGIKRRIQRTLYELIQLAPHTNDFSGENEDWGCSNGCRYFIQ